MYRFLLTPRWIGLGLLMAAAAAVMVLLGLWQLDRYHYRSDLNARIDAAALSTPLAVASGSEPVAADWARVSVTGVFDPSHEILARARTVGSGVGFEIITPLVLPDGTAVLVDRGWLPASSQGAATVPEIPAAPTGTVTVVGRVHAPESGNTTVSTLADHPSVRRISPVALASSVPYPLYGAYVNLESPADPAFVAIAPQHENALMNAGYVAQWNGFAALTVIGFIYLTVREARDRSLS